MIRVRSKRLCTAIMTEQVVAKLGGKKTHPNTVWVDLSEPYLQRLAARIRRKPLGCADIICCGTRYELCVIGGRLCVQWE